MNDLVTFLRARLDEDERLAASGESWTAFDETQGTRRVDVDNSIERVVACTRSWRGLHIARHDPARVLGDVDAKRRILDEHKPGEYGECVTCDVGAKSCGCCGWGDFPCDTVRLLALPYAGHSDYREEWRP